MYFENSKDHKKMQLFEQQADMDVTHGFKIP